MVREDREWAEIYCRYRHVRYLSHERYGDELRIAVEGPGEHYEVSVRVPSSASRDCAIAEPSCEGVNIINPEAKGETR